MGIWAVPRRAVAAHYTKIISEAAEEDQMGNWGQSHWRTIIIGVEKMGKGRRGRGWDAKAW